MGRMNDIYNAYLQNWKASHTNVVQPEVSSGKPDVTGATKLSGVSKFWDSFDGAYRLADGSVCEPSNWYTATWRSEAEWRQYSKPQSFNVYFGQW